MSDLVCQACGIVSSYADAANPNLSCECDTRSGDHCWVEQ